MARARFCAKVSISKDRGVSGGAVTSRPSIQGCWFAELTHGLIQSFAAAMWQHANNGLLRAHKWARNLSAARQARATPGSKWTPSYTIRGFAKYGLANLSLCVGAVAGIVRRNVSW